MSNNIYISADHRGVGLKLYLIEMLNAAGHKVVNLGTDDPKTMVDFPEITKRVTDAMLNDPDGRGIVICGFGGGAQIAANRFRHIRATRCERPEQAREDRFHDDINVLALSSEEIDPEIAMLCVQEFLDAPFDAIERRIRRIKEIS
ncbi:MAG: RpiB/LacA/LacB family sugar-phosphate isomerase [Alphaproteobacteria bacterium]|nr:RpiB/LacA/LacB family sugar-phosphate isomerase [Alphaproteobacteria bacterium]